MALEISKQRNQHQVACDKLGIKPGQRQRSVFRPVERAKHHIQHSDPAAQGRYEKCQEDKCADHIHEKSRRAVRVFNHPR